MEITLKLGSLLSLSAIAYQDFKERKVSVYLLILIFFFVAFLYYRKSSTLQFFINTSINLSLVLLIIGVLLAYSWYKLKQRLFEVFGLGDALFFLVLAYGFPSITFVVLFASSLLFSLLLFLLMKSKLSHKTVPLAGLQAIFLIVLFGLNWMFHLVNLYQ